MPLKIQKKERETSQNLIRRFKKVIHQSGILLEKRKRTFHKRQKSKNLKRKSALRRKKIKKEYKRLEKLGKSKDKNYVKGRY